MAYPPLYTRLSNFQRDANNGLASPAPAKVDAELNNIQLSLSQALTTLRAITSVDGRLRNVPSQTAAALVGTSYILGAGTNDLVTTIPWTSTISVNSILLMVGGQVLRPNQITSVQDDGLGYLEVTVAVAIPLATPCVVWAFEPGAGLLTLLASAAAAEGASLIGIQDAGNFYAAEDVEAALAEVAGAIVALQTALGDLADYFKRDGTVKATADFDFDGVARIINALDGVNPGDYVTVRQITGYIAAWSDLQQFYFKRDGSTALAGPMNFGNNKGYNLADPDLAQPLDAVNVRTLLNAIATGGAAPVGAIIDFAGDTAPTNWLLCDGSVYLGTTFPLLYSVLGVSYKSGPKQGCTGARFLALAIPDITAGVIVSLPTLAEPGIGYIAAPIITCENPPGLPAPTSQPTFNITVSPVVESGGIVTSGGDLTITLVGGGTGVLAGATLNISALSAYFTQLPNGYFRTPDSRGRVAVGAGTESRSPGIVDPPDVTKGDDYNATPRTVGQTGGEEKHRLVTAEMPYSVVVDGVGILKLPLAGATATRGSSTAHNTMPPYFVATKIIKAA